MKLLNSKAGVTILEGVIALGLLAVVTAGAFGVLLSAARKSTQPDMREEMAFAVEQAKDKLQLYVKESTAASNLPDKFKTLCGDADPLKEGSHYINCLLPQICDKNSDKSQFFYKVSKVSGEAGKLYLDRLGGYVEGGTNSKLCSACTVSADGNPSSAVLEIKFQITCNGYEL